MTSRIAPRPILIAAAIAASLALAGCTSSADDAASTPAATNPVVVPAPSETPDPEDSSAPGSDSASFATVDDLKAALIAAGFACDKWVESTGACGDDYTLQVFATAADRDVVVNKEQGKDQPTPMAIGANWIVTAGSNSTIDTMSAIVAKMGGFAVPQGS